MRLKNNEKWPRFRIRDRSQLRLYTKCRRKVRLYTSVSVWKVELCKELETLKVAFEGEIVDMAVEVEQLQELDFHLVEEFSGDSSQLGIVRVLEIKIIEVFCAHKHPRNHKAMNVTTSHVEVIMVFLNSVDENQGVYKYHRRAAHILEDS